MTQQHSTCHFDVITAAGSRDHTHSAAAAAATAGAVGKKLFAAVQR